MSHALDPPSGWLVDTRGLAGAFVVAGVVVPPGGLVVVGTAVVAGGGAVMIGAESPGTSLPPGAA
jgi:hypothetical protein